MSTVYDSLGSERIGQIIRAFYEVAFEDPIIGHFFWNFEREHLIEQQTTFAIGMLGGPRAYRGKPLPVAHQPLAIRSPHFGRRQLLLRQTLESMSVRPESILTWLSLEDSLKHVIISNQGCR